jgi:hypothetical protein
MTHLHRKLERDEKPFLRYLHGKSYCNSCSLSQEIPLCYGTYRARKSCHCVFLDTVPCRLYLKSTYKNNLWYDVDFAVSRGSSVTIVSGYGLDDRAIGVRSPAGAKDFSSSLCVQNGSETHPASCTMGTGGPFPGQSTAGAWRWPLPPSSAEVKNE